MIVTTINGRPFVVEKYADHTLYKTMFEPVITVTEIHTGYYAQDMTTGQTSGRMCETPKEALLALEEKNNVHV